MAEEKALLEQILKCVHDQTVLGDRRHEAQAAFNARLSHQLQSIREQQAQAAAAFPTAASAREAAESMLAKVALERGGDISASQEEILASASFLGGDNALPAASSDEDEGEQEEEVFATPPDARQHQGDPVTMCTLPFTPTPSKSKSPTHDTDDNAPPTKKPSVCIGGATISTPTPSPSQQQHQQPEPEQPAHTDPLVRAVLTIPAKTTTTSSSCPVQVQDFLALCRQKGII